MREQINAELINANDTGNISCSAELINANEAYFDLFSQQNSSKINENAELFNASDQNLGIAE